MGFSRNTVQGCPGGMSKKDLAQPAPIKNIKRYESQDPPKIEYPCDYPIKVLGDSGIDLYTLVMTVMESYSPGFNKSKTTVKDSKNGTYQAITVTITATGTEQIQSLFDDLKVNPLVKIVL